MDGHAEMTMSIGSEIAAGAIQVRERPAVRGLACRRPSVAGDRWPRDAARLLVAIALVLMAFLGLTEMGTVYGAAGMPPDGPAPGLGL